MTTVTEAARLDLLKRYHRAILHLRHCKSVSSLGLILGAGFSMGFKLPDWNKLVKDIAKHKSIQGSKLIRSPLSPLRDTQILFERLLQRQYPDCETPSHCPGPAEIQQAYVKWLEIVRHSLYAIDTSSEFKVANIAVSQTHQFY